MDNQGPNNYNNGNNKHNEHEACAASGVESGAGSGVFGGERKTFLEAGYRFMLRAVVLVGSAHIGHEGSEGDIADEDSYSCLLYTSDAADE